jgi:LPS sulfotransferase NodH
MSVEQQNTSSQQEKNVRRKTWNPPARPDWVRRFNEEGGWLDIAGIVPLDESSLIEAASRNTGLDDFGDEDWREPFRILIKSLDEEADLSPIGRIMTRGELLMYLEGRLRIEDAFRQNPEIADEKIENPLLILGQGRSGTTYLHELLELDPRHRAPQTWEWLMPLLPECDNPEFVQYWREIADRRITLWNRVTPEFQACHHFKGEQPCESIYTQVPSFQCAVSMGTLGQVPSYNRYMANQGMEAGLKYERRVLQAMQWRESRLGIRRRWILKSPDHLRDLPAVMAVYPDIRFVWSHRDPVKALASMVNLIGNMLWIKSDRLLPEGAYDNQTDAHLMAALMSRPIEWLESGEIKQEQLCNIQYLDLVADPMGTVKGIYDYFGWQFSAEAQGCIADYIASHPREKRRPQNYTDGERDIIEKDRQAFRRYQEYFSVVSEI